jgi:tryptophanyl-tRNA synthetase
MTQFKEKVGKARELASAALFYYPVLMASDVLVYRGTGRAEIEREFDGVGYGDFKAAVADGVVELLAPVRERYEELRPDEAALEATLAAGAEKARAIASVTVADVRERMGFG